MFARKLLTGTLAGAVSLSVIALTAGTASAATDDTTGTPVAADLVGVGSDTSQNAVFRVAQGYNATTPAPANKIFSYAALGGGTITLPDGTSINRPNGSGAGKALLYGAGNNAQIDFARSSSGQSDAETAALLQSFPFALDTLVMAVSGSVASHAPTNLTPAQIVSIYNGSVTNWSQLGGSSGVIAPKIPQAGSGTRSFFVAQLKAANGGTDVTLAGTVTEVQEHDDATIKNDANAVAPFSEGRAGLLGSTLRLETGLRADRALYNVVRGSDVGNAGVLAAFGSNGYICSAAAKPLIAAAGFKQLLPPSKGGVCGSPTQTATSNFTTDTVATSTGVTVTSASASSARVVARIAASTAPNGTVTFFEGTTPVATNVPLVSGAATATPAAAPGTHTYRAVFTPAPNTAFSGSEGTGSGVVSKATSTSKAAFGKAKLAKKKGKLVVKPLKGSVTVTVVGSSSKASGAIVVKKGSKTIGTGTLSGGIAKLSLKGLKVGKNKLTATWAGDANATGSSISFTVTVKAATKK